eukprot:1780730-Pleurochrysis_carterae.AAC.2
MVPQIELVLRRRANSRRRCAKTRRRVVEAGARGAVDALLREALQHEHDASVEDSDGREEAEKHAQKVSTPARDSCIHVAVKTAGHERAAAKAKRGGETGQGGKDGREQHCYQEEPPEFRRREDIERRADGRVALKRDDAVAADAP